MVVHVSFSGKYYGRENAAFSLVKALGGKINVTMLLVIEERLPAKDREDLLAKLAEFGIDSLVLTTDKAFSLETATTLAAAYKRVNAKIIHCHCYKSAVYSILLRLFRKIDARIVMTLHGLVLPLSAKALFHYFLYYFSMLFVDGIIGCSKQIVTGISKIPVMNRKVTAIQNGYENPNLLKYGRSEAREALKSIGIESGNKLLIANVGRLNIQKNPIMFLRIVKRAVEYCSARNIPVHFVMAGDGELREEVEKAAREMAITDYLTVTGYVTDMPMVYAAIDIMLMTSDWEGTPMCILEAMSCSLPVVAPCVGGVPDLIEHDQTGLLFPQRDEDECFKQLVRAIESPELRRSVGEKAFLFYKSDLNLENWADRHIRYYNGLLQGGR